MGRKGKKATRSGGAEEATMTQVKVELRKQILQPFPYCFYELHAIRALGSRARSRRLFIVRRILDPLFHVRSTLLYLLFFSVSCPYTLWFVVYWIYILLYSHLLGFAFSSSLSPPHSSGRFGKKCTLT